jgi:hypothetical protein
VIAQNLQFFTHCVLLIFKGARADFHMWIRFLTEFNGRAAFLQSEWLDSSTLKLFTDASATLGYGAYFDGQWFNGVWPPETLVNKHSIAILELYPIVIAVKVWGGIMANRKIKMFCDNQSVTEVINKQSSHCAVIMELVRELVGSCLQYNILLHGQFLPGWSNSIADALSRQQMDRFRHEAPRATSWPTPIPTRHWLLSGQKCNG